MDDKGTNFEVIKSKNIFDAMNDRIASFMESKDSLIDEDLLEGFSDAFKIVKLLNNGRNYIVKKRLAHFLKGFNACNEPTEKQLNRLYDYIKDEKRAEYVTDSVNKAINSNSTKSSFLIGLIFNRRINSDEEFDYKDLICINALQSFNDFDIDNLIIIKNYFYYYRDIRRRNSKIVWFDLYRGFKNYCKEKEINVDNSLELTAEKCIAYQIVIRSIEAEIDIDDDSPGDASVNTDESIKFSGAGIYLLEHLNYLESIQ
ncbi:hypothetical protein [Helicovermis profundi]|uniref:Uncharacterized protein n=1 Tax=Helicovermis profundi TaxID=3065157 RepID=A0AAU9E5G8_9FIRM|nr:hypothetical protein HLPR_01630 [Clostridia bacterium S502]BEP29205.1 hypothetical protein HLPR_15360 [Clostridia bacterium S502]